ncbi:VOC family protein [Nocardia arthritidis]|nr:VOC family protein [Nocardia arthritidis]
MPTETYPRFMPLLYIESSEEALAFYTDVFDLEEIVERRFPYNQAPGGEHLRGLAYSKLQFKDGTAMSVAERQEWDRPGDTIHVGLNYDDPKEQKAAFDKLADGGTVVTALDKVVWDPNQIYGMVRDRYGVTWETNCYV